MHLHDDLGTDFDLVARFWFWASNAPSGPADKIDDLRYVLEMYDDGAGWTGPFPPALGQEDPSSRTATRWEMRTERKGSLKNEPCVTDGIESFDDNSVYFEVSRWK